MADLTREQLLLMREWLIPEINYVSQWTRPPVPTEQYGTAPARKAQLEDLLFKVEQELREKK